MRPLRTPLLCPRITLLRSFRGVYLGPFPLLLDSRKIAFVISSRATSFCRKFRTIRSFSFFPLYFSHKRSRSPLENKKIAQIWTLFWGYEIGGCSLCADTITRRGNTYVRPSVFSLIALLTTFPRIFREAFRWSLSAKVFLTLFCI